MYCLMRSYVNGAVLLISDYLKYCNAVMQITKAISNTIIKSKYFPAEPTFILEYILPNPERNTRRPIK